MVSAHLTLERFAENFDDAITKLKTLGLRISATRIARYRRIIAEAVAAERRGDVRHQLSPSFINAIVEASEIIDIASLRMDFLTSDAAKEKLLRISSGPEVMAPDGHDPARDYGFELSTAAKAYSNDCFVGFPSTGDLVVLPGSRPVECKRLSSVGQFERRLREARDQLDRRFRNGEPPGIIAMDFTRPLRLTHGSIVADSDDLLVDAAEKQITAFVGRNLLSTDLDKIAAESTLGILIRYLAVGTAGDPGHIRRAAVWQGFSIHPEESNENKAFLAAAAFLGPEPMRDISLSDIAYALETVPEK